jgi:hypothetical protein
VSARKVDGAEQKNSMNQDYRNIAVKKLSNTNARSYRLPCDGRPGYPVGPVNVVVKLKRMNYHRYHQAYRLV